jgi:hypothetical protein
MDYTLAHKRDVQDAFEQILELLDAKGREPDRREEEMLSRSLSAMTCGMYALAAFELNLCAKEIDERSEETMEILDAPPQKLTKQQMHRGLAQIRAYAK